MSALLQGIYLQDQPKHENQQSPSDFVRDNCSLDIPRELNSHSAVSCGGDFEQRTHHIHNIKRSRVCNGVTSPLLTMMHYPFQSLDDGFHSRIVFLPQLQEMSRDKGLQNGLQDLNNND